MTAEKAKRIQLIINGLRFELAESVAKRFKEGAIADVTLVFSAYFRRRQMSFAD
jgi:hypothetical protein